MTIRLYYDTSDLREFEAHVIDVGPHEGRPAAVLDRTAFYPTSGGQPFDVGSLGEARVLDVVDREDGTIVHVLDREIPVGPATGRIDWERRFDHMQQHTGQHVLSAAMDKVLGARTVSFHLGAERSTIDVSRDLTPAEIARAEREANRVVWEDRAVTVRFVSEEEAAALPLRKEPKRTGKLRLVEVTDYDLSACGGTHVARTGAIGLIAVTSAEKYKGGTRVEFVCGSRALRDFGLLREAVAGSIRHVSVLPGELPDAIARLQTESKQLQRTIRSLQERLAVADAQALVARASRVGDWRVAIEPAEWDAGGLKALAIATSASPAVVAVLFNPAGGLLVVGRSADVPLDASAIVKGLVARFGGRGGGRPELAQAGGLSGEPDAVLGAARALVHAAAGPTPAGAE